MQQQWPHDEGIASVRKTGLLAATHRGRLTRTNDALTVRAWHYINRSIVFAAIVQVDAHGDHMLQQR